MNTPQRMAVENEIGAVTSAALILAAAIIMGVGVDVAEDHLDDAIVSYMKARKKV